MENSLDEQYGIDLEYDANSWNNVYQNFREFETSELRPMMPYIARSWEMLDTTIERYMKRLAALSQMSLENSEGKINSYSSLKLAEKELFLFYVSYLTEHQSNFENKKNEVSSELEQLRLYLIEGNILEAENLSWKLKNHISELRFFSSNLYDIGVKFESLKDCYNFVRELVDSFVNSFKKDRKYENLKGKTGFEIRKRMFNTESKISLESERKKQEEEQKRILGELGKKEKSLFFHADKVYRNKGTRQLSNQFSNIITDLRNRRSYDNSQIDFFESKYFKLDKELFIISFENKQLSLLPSELRRSLMMQFNSRRQTRLRALQTPSKNK